MYNHLFSTTVPPFLVYYGLEKDLNAAEVLKWVPAMDRDGGGKEMIIHLQKFLLYLLSIHNNKNPNPYVHNDIMIQTPSDDAKNG